MTDEEKKAIKRIDYIQDFIIENGQYNADINDMEYFSRVLNLIEKQSKEIEELKEKSIHITKETVDFVNTHYISKGRIEEKIEEVKDGTYDAKIVLQSLLEKE